jgi:hypothetical protein
VADSAVGRNAKSNSLIRIQLTWPPINRDTPRCSVNTDNLSIEIMHYPYAQPALTKLFTHRGNSRIVSVKKNASTSGL